MQALTNVKPYKYVRKQTSKFSQPKFIEILAFNTSHSDICCRSTKTEWKDLKVGEIVQLHNNEHVPVSRKFNLSRKIPLVNKLGR